MTADATGPSSVYRLDLRHALRLFGSRVLLGAVMIVLAAVCLETSATAVRVVGYLLAAAGAALLAFALLRLVRPPAVVTLTSSGYRVHRVPGCGAQAATWDEVAGVEDRTGPLGPTLHLALADDATTLPLILVADRSLELQREVRERLNRAHGYQGLV